MEYFRLAECYGDIGGTQESLLTVVHLRPVGDTYIRAFSTRKF